MVYQAIETRAPGNHGHNSDDKRQPRTAPNKHGLVNVMRQWTWEFLTWTVATIAVACIIALLTHFNNRPMNEWKSKVQITAMMAALAQVAQSALLVSAASCISQLKWSWFTKARPVGDIDIYDKASRGPDGCLRLLFQLPRPRLVSLGAFTTILLLAFQTFVQQAVSADTRSISTDGVAKLRYARTYESPLSAWEVTPQIGKGYGGIRGVTGHADYYMYDAIASGMAGRNWSLSDVLGTCPSPAEKCTWDPHVSLAISASVDDISDQVYQVNETNHTATHLVPGMPVPRPAELNILTLSYNNPMGFNTPKAANGGADLAHIYTVANDSCARNWTAKAYKTTMRLCLRSLDSTRGTALETKVRSPDIEPVVNWIERKHVDCLQRFNYIGKHEVTRGKCTYQCGTLQGSADEFCIRDTALKGMGWLVASVFNVSASFDRTTTDTGSAWDFQFINDIYGDDAQ